MLTNQLLKSVKVNNIIKDKKILCFLVSFLVIMSGSFIPASAQSSCSYNGRRYAHGSVIGDYQCQNGRWVRIR